MRPIQTGIAAFLRATVICGAMVLGLAGAAHAATPAALPAGLATPITKEQHTQGMKEAPALVTALALPCQVSDARFIGSSKDPKTKVESKLYEVACTDAMGYMISATPPTTPQWYDCLQINEQNGAKPGAPTCRLQGNIDNIPPLRAFLVKAGSNCGPLQGRSVGHNATAAFFEVSCDGGTGVVLKLSSPPDVTKPIQVINCISVDPTSSLACKLTTMESQLAVADKLAAASGKNCTVKDRRYILSTADNSNYFEVACQDGKGYVLQQAADGSLARSIDCANADFVNGGCTLTNSREQRTEQNALYTKLARKGGFECDVAKYGPFNSGPPNHEVVELACSNRTDGAIAIFPASGAEAAVFYDCAHSELVGFRCSFSKPDAAYPNLTNDLKALGKKSCVVASSRVVGVSADKHAFVEVGCSDGLPGFMIDYTMNPLKPAAALTCTEAKGISGGCKLAGNVPK